MVSQDYGDVVFLPIFHNSDVLIPKKNNVK